MINWGDIRDLNIESIDEEHKVFFTIVEEAENLLKISDTDIYTDILESIKRIQVFSKNHFASEEELMENINYPHLAEHKLEHDLFMAQITDIDLNIIKDNHEKYLLRSLDFLVEWIILHMADFDKEMAKYYHEVYKK